MASSRHDDLKIRIATIKRGDRGHSKNTKVTWGRLRELLSDPVRDDRYTLPQYLELPIDKQNKIKDVGSFVGGPFRDGLRKATNLIQRSIVTLDIDSATAKQMKALSLGLSSACVYEFFGSTTRKHTAEKPRWRLVFPLTRPVTVEEYAPLARILASTLFRTVAESMDAVDDVSYRPAQVMYWPSVCKKALFETIHNKGELLDPDKVLSDFGDWTDWTLLPFSEKRGQKRPTTGKKAEDPREKKGIIGAFCRAYDVPSAIDAYLPEIYLPGDENSSKPRYTYAHGSSSNGAIVEDDGLFLYSHHGTDPCAERLVNAFDLVRIHLFGEMDHDAPEDARPTELPSFQEMRRLLRKDEEVQANLDDDYTEYEAPKFQDLGEEDEPEQKPAKETVEKDEEDDSPDMEILKDTRVAPPKFPIDVLGEFWSERAELWAKNSAAPVDYTAMTILTGAGALIGNSRWVSPKDGWKEPPVLWCSLIGPPSANKSPAIGNLTSILSDLEATWLPQYQDELRLFESEKKEAQFRRRIWEQGAEKALEEDENDLIGMEKMPAECMEPERPVRRRAFMDDATLESLLKTLAGNPRGLLSLRDEMASWFANLTRYTQGSDRPAWLQAYGGRRYTVDRVKDEGRPTVVEHFSVPILGGIQPERLLEVLNSAEDGLQARFIYVWPEDKPRFIDEGIPEDNGAELSLRRLSELPMDFDRHGRHAPVIRGLSPKAWRKFRDWTNARKMTEGTAFPALRSAYGKADGLVLRIAIILEYLWWSSGAFVEDEEPQRVSAKAISAAIRLRDTYIKPMQMRTYGHLARGAHEAHAGLLAAWIVETRPKEVTVRDILRSARIPGLSNLEAKDVMGAIEYLQEGRWLDPVDTAASSKRGRPKRAWRVRKAVYKAIDKASKSS